VAIGFPLSCPQRRARERFLQRERRGADRDVLRAERARPDLGRAHGGHERAGADGLPERLEEQLEEQFVESGHAAADDHAATG
jgi:hypothetical protein